MGLKTKNLLLSAMLLTPYWCLAQDFDHDGIDDRLEQELAKKFAPEWRFNARVKGVSSRQNKDAVYFPSSVEWWFKHITHEKRRKLQIEIDRDGKSIYIDLTDINQLDQIVDPISGCQLNDDYWNWADKTIPKKYGNPKVKIIGQPKWIRGDPEHFPTYFNCRTDSNDQISISFFLFYAYDHKGYNIPFVNTGDHRVDWEGINLVLSGVTKNKDDFDLSQVEIEKVFYSGHGHQKYLTPQDIGFNCVDDTHTQVFISWGSHACYPQAGEWHNYKSPGPDIYDDFFHGNGLVVQSWDSARKLINVGEEQCPLVGWLTYRGLWGEDGTSANASPPSPPGKGFWFSVGARRIKWSEAIRDYAKYWNYPPKLD